MSKRPAGKIFVAAAFVLTVIGLILLASTSVPLSQQNFGESYYYFRHQLIYGFGVGLVLFFITRKVRLGVWRKLALPLFLLAILFLVLVFVPSVGFGTAGARRWLSLGPLSFQPAELAKVALILYLAAWLDKRHEKLARTSSFVSWLVIVGGVAALVALQPDIGTTVLIVGVGLTMYFAAGARLKSLALITLLAAIGFGALIATDPERMSRVKSVLNPASDVQGESYQLNQALIAIGSGGFFGKGLGKSIQQYQYLPESINDSIFAIIGEEFGFVFSSIFILLFVLLLLAGFKLARSARTRFGTLVTVGVVSWFGLQALINIAGITGLIPFTGITLPFISYGGTALALELAAVGIVSSVSRN